MNSYQKVFESAIADYGSLPFETKELYKKYLVNLQIPEQIGQRSGVSLDSVRNAISEASRLKFDAVVSNNVLVSSSEYVHEANIEGSPDTKKDFSSTEEKLAHFIHFNLKKMLVIEIPSGKRAKLNILFLCNSNMPLEIAVNVGSNSKLDLFEWFASAAKESSILAPLHAISVESNSEAEINVLHNENASTVVGALSRAKVMAGSSLRFNSIYNGSSVTKSTSYADAVGKNSRVFVNELVLGSGDQKFDISTFIVNSNVQTTAMIRSGAALKQRSFCVLKGYAKVSKGADGAYSNVEERGLVLDLDARMQPLPDMSIDHNNVTFASHSASTAPIDGESLFYMMSRGLSEEKAKRIFIASFLSKYLAEIDNDIVKEIAISILLHKLDTNTLVDAPKISVQDMWVVPSRKR